MTLRTSLVIAGESEGAERALDNVDDGLAKVEVGATKAASSTKVAERSIAELATTSQTAAGALGRTAGATHGLATAEAELTATTTSATAASVAQTGALAANATAANAAASGMARLAGGAAIGALVAAGTTVIAVLGALAAAAAFLAGSLAVFAVQLNQSGELQAYAKSLGLTKDEMKELGDIGVTTSEVLTAVWQTFSEIPEIQMLLTMLKATAISVFEAALSAAKSAAAGIYAGFVGTFNAVRVIWTQFPAVMGEAVVGAANLAITAVESMVNRGVDGVNQLIGTVNAVGSALGISYKLATLSAIQFGRISNANAGAAAKAAADIGAGYSGAYRQAIGAMEGFYTKTSERIVSNKKAQLDAKAAAIKGDRDAEDGAKKHGRAAKKQAEEVDELAKAFARVALEAQKAENALEKSMGKDIRDWLKGAADAWDDTVKLFDEKREQAFKKVETDAADAQRQVEELTQSLQSLTTALDQIGGKGGAILGDIGALLVGLQSGNFSGLTGPLGAIAQLATQGEDGQQLVKSLNTALDRVFGGAGSFSKMMGKLLEGAGIGAAAGSLVLGKDGNALGSAIGGALGQKLGEKFLSKGFETIAKGLGDFAGPIGSILGGIAGGLIGKVLSGTQRGGATFGGAGSSLGVGGTWGNSDQRIGASSDLAGAVVASLDKIASALGAKVTTFTGSISMREGNLRYDPTGSGISKTSKGALNFGQDEAALIKAVLKDAISDGVFDGLSDGVKRILNGGGDIEEQLQKALSFQGVFDELKQLKDPQAYALEQLDGWRKGMDAIFTEAGATADELAKLEELTGLKRAEIVERYAADVVNAEEIVAQKRQLEIEIMRLEGNELGALAATRDIERAAADESLRPLYDRIYALQDERTAATAAAEAAQALAEEQAALAEQQAAQAAAAAARVRAIADERYGLETQLLQLLGDTKALRERELAQLDPSNRAIKERIWALEDEAAATSAATGSMQDAARALMLAGDSAAYASAQMNGALSGKATGDPRADAAVKALSEASAEGQQFAFEKLQAILFQNARAELSANALLVSNIGEALDAIPNIAANAGTTIGWGLVNGISQQFAKVTGQALNRELATVLGQQRGRARYGDLGAPGIAGVRAASEQSELASMGGWSSATYNRIVTSLGSVAEGLLGLANGEFTMLGQDVSAFVDALMLLDGQVQKGVVSAEDARTYIAGLVELFPQLAETAQSMERQLARAERAARFLTQSGLNSVELYFGSLAEMTEELAQNGSAASQTINGLSGAIGRMNSFATVFTESVAAVQQGLASLANVGASRTLSEEELKNIAAAEAISAAARQAAKFLISQQAAGITAALADTAAFAGVSPELRKTAALLLEGVTAYDVPAFEAAFVRMSNALANGTINVDQFNALFAYSQTVFEDTAASFAQLSSTVADELREIIDILNGGIDALNSKSAVMQRYEEDRALAYLRAIDGVPDLNDTFRDAVSTVSALTTDRFSTRLDFLRELGQRTALLGELRTNTEDALTEVNLLTDIKEELKTTNQQLAELREEVAQQKLVSAGMAGNVEKMRVIAQDQEENGVPVKDWVG